MDGAKVFADRYEIDWVHFLVNGIDSEFLLGLDNAMITKVVEQILGESNGQQ
jgi:hypothetical protein